MTVIFQDNFNRANGDVGSNYDHRAGDAAEVINNRLVLFNNGTKRNDLRTNSNAHTAVTNVRISITKIFVGSANCCLNVRDTGTGGSHTCYTVDFTNNIDIELGRIVDGEYEELASWQAAHGDSDKIGVQIETVNGNPVITPLINDTPVGTPHTDTSSDKILGPGYVGIGGFYNGNIIFDDLIVEDLQEEEPDEPVELEPEAASLVLDGSAPQLRQAFTIRPQTGALALEGYSSAVLEIGTLEPQGASLTITGYAPTLAIHGALRPDTAALAIAGDAPLVKESRFIQPQTGALTINGLSPDLTLGVPAPRTAELSIEGFAPLIKLGVGVSIQPETGALAITGYEAQIAQTNAPGTAELALTGYAPFVRQMHVLAPGTVAMTLTGSAPVMRQGIFIIPDTGAIALTGSAPVLRDDQVIQPLTGSLAIAGQIADVSIPGYRTPLMGDLALTGYAPLVEEKGNFTRIPQTGALSLIGYRPRVIDSSLVGVVGVSGAGVSGGGVSGGTALPGVSGSSVSG